MSNFLKSCFLISSILFASSCVLASDVEMNEDHTKVSENVEDAQKVDATKATAPTSKSTKKKHKDKAKKAKSTTTKSTTAVAPVDTKTPVAKNEATEHKN